MERIPIAKKTFKVKRPPKPVSPRYEQELNSEQRAVVLHEKGPALVIAGAGSGKTRALTYRVAYLIEQGVPPQSIVLVTFTKKAAEEMKKRADVVSGGRAKGIMAGTFHHLCNLFLRKYAPELGYTRNYSILDPADQRELMKLVMGTNIPKEQRKRFPKSGQFADIYSKSINLEKKVKEIVAEEYPDYINEVPTIKRVLGEYHQRKRANNAMDFDDMLVNFVNLLRGEGAAAKIRKKVRHVLVDEFQDVNAIQADIVNELAAEAESLAVVGDDAQAIYGWRGADFTHMLNFESTYPGTTAYKLETNYRSRPEILDLANASIAQNERQFPKTLRPTRQEGELPAVCPCSDADIEAYFVCNKVLEFRDDGIPLEEQAVLFRGKAQRIAVEKACVAFNIPYVVRAGMRFFEQAHIKDVLAYLMVLVNPVDEVQWARILGMHEGVGETAVQKILSTFISHGRPMDTFVDAEFPTLLKGQRVQSRGLTSVAQLQKFIKDLAYEPGSPVMKPVDQWPPLPDLLQRIVEYFTPLRERYYENFKDRQEDLRELVNFSTKYSDPTAFLSDILTMLEFKGETIVDGPDIDQERPLVLTTIHQAKGLEWQVVYLIGLVGGQFPSSYAIGNPDQMEEERRLFYVACTRAKDHLFLTYPQFVPRFYQDDVIGKPSIFLEEIRDAEVYEEWEIDD